MPEMAISCSPKCSIMAKKRNHVPNEMSRWNIVGSEILSTEARIAPTGFRKRNRSYSL